MSDGWTRASRSSSSFSRHDEHHRLGRRDDAADRVHVELVDEAGAGRADIHALQLVFGGDLALRVFGDLALHLAKLLHGLGAHLLVDLDHLERGFGDAAFGLRDGGDELPALAFDAGAVALERVEARELHEVLLVEFADALELLGDEGGLAGFRGLLGAQAL